MNVLGVEGEGGGVEARLNEGQTGGQSNTMDSTQSGTAVKLLLRVDKTFYF